MSIFIPFFFLLRREKKKLITLMGDYLNWFRVCVCVCVYKPTQKQCVSGVFVCVFVFCLGLYYTQTYTKTIYDRCFCVGCLFVCMCSSFFLSFFLFFFFLSVFLFFLFILFFKILYMLGVSVCVLFFWDKENNPTSFSINHLLLIEPNQASLNNCN